MEKQKLKERIIYYDILNIIACIAVIALHLQGGVVYRLQTWNGACFKYGTYNRVCMLLGGSYIFNFVRCNTYEVQREV